MIGSRIRAAREAKGLSQERLATLVKTSRRNVLRWEGGYNTPRVEHIEAIARETDQTVDFFMAPPLSRLALGRGNDPRRGSLELAARRRRP